MDHDNGMTLPISQHYCHHATLCSADTFLYMYTSTQMGITCQQRYWGNGGMFDWSTNIKPEEDSHKYGSSNFFKYPDFLGNTCRTYVYHMFV